MPTHRIGRITDPDRPVYIEVDMEGGFVRVFFAEGEEKDATPTGEEQDIYVNMKVWLVWSRHGEVLAVCATRQLALKARAEIPNGRIEVWKVVTS